jgi:CRP/FNR family cyclic AMP-dependent transcriptional regulator
MRRGARTVRRGRAIFTQGDRAERVFLCERGWILITSIAPGDREIVVGLRGPGDLIGCLSALDGAPRSARRSLRVLASRLRDANPKRVEFAALDTLGRVAWRLQELSERFGEQTAEGIEVELPLSQEQLASWCGASREATVKALSAPRTLACIATGRRRVLIRDIAGLRRHAYGAL